MPGGRPPSEKPRKHPIPVRFSDEEHAEVAAAAERAGKPVGVWLREKALTAAKRQR